MGRADAYLSMALSEGTKIGSYEVIGLIGQGRMGQVWQARDLKRDRARAVNGGFFCYPVIA